MRLERTIIHIGAIYSSLRSLLFVSLQWTSRERRRAGWLVGLRVAGPGNNQNSSRKRRTVAFTPSLDVSFPPTGRKFPFPYGGVCLSLAAGQSGQTRGKKGGKRKMAVRGYRRDTGRERERGASSRSKNSRLKEFKYTLEIKTACTRAFEPFPRWSLLNGGAGYHSLRLTLCCRRFESQRARFLEF